MNNRIDKFFESKLSEHTIEPDAKVWSQIAANLPKKNKGIIWLRAAAGIAVAGLALMLWFYSGTNQAIDNSLVHESNDAEALRDIPKPQAAPVTKEEGQPIDEQKRAPLMAAQNNTRKYSIAEKTEARSSVVKTDLKVDDKSKEVTQIDRGAEVVVNGDVVDLTASPAVSKETSKPIVIVYELPDVTKMESPYDIDLTPQKKSGIKKVLEIANDVRTGESPIAGLRQAKEEIFAFNFKKEDKNNNK